MTAVKDLSEEVVDSRIRQPEIYTEEHEKLLGPCEQNWELFKDGFGPDGNRIYDSAIGKTCHQCRSHSFYLFAYLRCTLSSWISTVVIGFLLFTFKMWSSLRCTGVSFIHISFKCL